MKPKKTKKITIILDKDEIEHFKDGYHTFYDCCSRVETIMKKVVKQLTKDKR